MRQLYKVIFTTALLLFLGQAMASSVSLHPLKRAGLIAKNVTINVPGELPDNIYSNCDTRPSVYTIQQALSCLDNFVISPAAIVTINVKQNFQNLKTIVVNHPDGSQIHIVGDCAGNANHVCTLQFAAGQNGISVTNGHTLGELANFALIGGGTQTGSGLFIKRDSQITISGNLSIMGFNRGINTSGNSIVNLMKSNTSLSNNWGGMGVYSNSVLMSDKLSITHNHYGIYLDSGAQVYLYNATVSNNETSGIVATIATHMSIAGSHFVNNSINASLNSVIYGGVGTTVTGSSVNCATGGIVTGVNGNKNCINGKFS